LSSLGSLPPSEHLTDWYSGLGVSAAKWTDVKLTNQIETMAYIMWNFQNLTIKLWRHGRQIFWEGCVHTIPSSFLLGR
jgi:hypothetical protein